MDDSIPQLPQDDAGQAAGDVTSRLEGAADSIDSLGDNLTTAIEGGLDSITQQVEDVLGGLDNFLGKF